MDRLPRVVIHGQPLHVIVRGNNRQAIFCADEDCWFYLDKLNQACAKHACNHYAQTEFWQQYAIRDE